ncbi:MAG: cupin domain-containing protein [Bacteroidia bacterium]|nr:cupin domain-containing protein [Bacteroidia bacterium]
MRYTFLTDEIQYQDDKFAQRIIFTGKGGSIRLLALKAGQHIPVHATPFPAFLLILEGTLRFTYDEMQMELPSGACWTIEPEAPHALEAIENTKALLIR